MGDPCIDSFPDLKEINGKMFVPEKKFHHLNRIT